MQFLWEESTRRGITIHVHNALTEPLARENDLFLMDEIVKVFKKPALLKRINAVRLYLRVSRLSDIATESGDKLQQWAMEGQPNPNTALE